MGGEGVRRVGLPVGWLEGGGEGVRELGGGVEAVVEEAELSGVEDWAEVEPEFVVKTTSAGVVDEVTMCFAMVAEHHGKAFPRDAVRSVLRNELPEGTAPTLHLCGAVAAMAGFGAQLVRIQEVQLTRLELPVMLMLDGSVVVVCGFGGGMTRVAHPREGLKRIPTGELMERFSGGVDVLLLRPLPEAREKFGLRWFLPEIQRYKRVLFEVFVASLFIQLFGLANPLLTQMIIDKVLVQNSLHALNVLGVLFIIVALADTVLSGLRTYLFVDTTNRIDLALGGRIIEHLFRLRLGYFQGRPVGEVSSRLQELENIRKFLTGTALTVGMDAVFSVVYVGIMLFYNPVLTVIALAVVPLLGGVTLACAPVLRRQIQKRSQDAARTQAHLIESLTGVQTVKAGNMEQHCRWEWQKRYAGFVSSGFHAVLTATAANSANSVLSRLGDLAVLWYGAVLVIQGELTLGQLIAFRIIAGHVTNPLMRLAQSWQNFQEVALSVERLGDVMDSPAEQPEEQRSSIPMPTVRGAVRFDDVTFSYIPGRPPQLRNVSFEVAEGSFVAVVGKSGSGKSTVLKLLPRLYMPDSGRVLVDGYETAKVELYSLRRQIGTVLQDGLLFNESVFANISLSNPDASAEEVMRAARVAAAHDFIMGLPEGYNTMVGEQGRALSGGQRQRIAIASAVLRKPRLLILDEATSALDLPAEREVCMNLAEEFKGRTVFFVTHRVRSITHADLILVFDRGVLVEQGRHADLMERKGVYHALHAAGGDEV